MARKCKTRPCVRTTIRSVNETVPPSLQFLQSDSSCFGPSAIDTSSTRLMMSLGQREILCNLKSEVPIYNLGEETLGSLTRDQGSISEFREGVQNEQKNIVGKEGRWGGATKKGARGSLFNYAVQTYNGVVLPASGLELVPFCKGISERTEKKPRRTFGVPGIKKGKRRTSTNEGLSTGDGLRGVGSYSGSGILDVYGIKTKPVDLRKFMTEISLKDLLTGDYKMHQPIHHLIGPQKGEHKGSFYVDINRILQCCLKWPLEAAISPENHYAVNLRGQCSVECGHATNFGSRPETIVYVKNSTENSSVETTFCSKIADRRGSLETGPLVSELSSMWRALNINDVFSVDHIPLKPFGNCIKSLKLSKCELLDDLITQAAGFDVKDQAMVTGTSSTCNTYTIPPLPYSYPPVGMLKSDVHRCIVKGNLLQAHMMKRINDRTGEFESNGLQAMELKQATSMHKRANLGCKADTTATVHRSMDSSECMTKKSLCADVGSPNARKEDFSLAKTADPKSVFGNAKLCDNFRKNQEPTVDFKLVHNESLYRGDVSKVHDTEISIPVEQAHVKHKIRNTSTTVHQGSGVAHIVGQSQVDNGGSLKDRSVLQAAKALPHLKHCCDSHLSHSSSSIPDDAISPRAFAAACILYHMANELPFSSTVEKKGHQKSLDRNPGLQFLKSAKRPSASVPVHNNGKGYARCKTSPTPNKFPVAERKKSLSQVSSALVVPAKTSTCTISGLGDWTPSVSVETVVASKSNILVQPERGGQMHSRGKSRVSGNGPTSHVLSPPIKPFVQSLPKSTQRFGSCTKVRDL